MSEVGEGAMTTQRRGSKADEPKSVFKAIKAIKRRGVESIFQKIGASEATVDQDYDEAKRRFDRTIRELNELGAGMAAYLERSRDMFTTCSDLAEVTYEYYWGRLMVDWPGAPNHLRSHTAATKYKEAWHHSNDNVRRSVAKLWLDRGLTPVRAYMNAIVPEVQHEADQRDAYVKDYDSYRRRVHTLKEKQGKVGDPGSQKAMELERDLTTLQAKLTTAEENYITQNAKVKEDMIRAKVARDEMIEMSIMTMVACQVELFQHTNDMLQSMMTFLPAEKLAPIRKQIQTLIATGGPDVKPAELSDMQKAVQVATGVAVPSDFVKTPAQLEEENRQQAIKLEKARQHVLMEQGGTLHDTSRRGISDSALPPSPSPPAPSRAAPPNPFSPTSPSPSLGSTLDNFKKSLFSPSANPASPPLRAAPVPPTGSGFSASPPPGETAGSKSGNPLANMPPTPPKRVMAKALFDNEPDDESELAFVTGDVLEIIMQDDSGWWEARLNGRSGSIPANYVQLL